MRNALKRKVGEGSFNVVFFNCEDRKDTLHMRHDREHRLNPSNETLERFEASLHNARTIIKRYAQSLHASTIARRAVSVAIARRISLNVFSIPSISVDVEPAATTHFRWVPAMLQNSLCKIAAMVGRNDWRQRLIALVRHVWFGNNAANPCCTRAVEAGNIVPEIFDGRPVNGSDLADYRWYQVHH